MRGIHKLVLAVLVGVLAVSATPAGAVVGYAPLCPSLGTAFCTPGTIVPSDGVAVDNSGGASAGDVWVVSGDEGIPEGKLVKFDASGNVLLEVDDENLPGSALPLFLSLPTLKQDAVDPVRRRCVPGKQWWNKWERRHGHEVRFLRGLSVPDHGERNTAGLHRALRCGGRRRWRFLCLRP